MVKTTEPATDEQQAFGPTRVVTNEDEAGKEASSPSPTLRMFDAGEDEAGACTADSCAVTIRKG